MKKIFLLLLLFSAAVLAQWSNNPAVNLTICDTTGEQATPKIASISDGGTYVCWFDNRSGSYAVYLQRLDVYGNKLWAPNGLLISNNPQSSSLVDWDMITDQDDNAVIVFTDTRNGDLNVFAYRISPSGNFLWGNNGVGLSTTMDYQANPKVVQTGDGNFVVCWIFYTSPVKTAIQKLSPTGDKLWGTSPLFISSATEGFNYPHIVKSDSNGVLILHTATTGNFPAQTVKLKATKITSAGAVSWQVYLQELGRIAAFSVPEVISDMNNGGIIAWHDDRDMDNLQNGFVQRVSSSGSLYFPVNGAEVSLTPGTHKFNPVPAFNPATGETYVFWKTANDMQSQFGVSGQKISTNGARLWTDNGITFKALAGNSLSYFNAQSGNNNAYVFYLEGDLTSIVEGFACDQNGTYLWPGNFVTLSNAVSDKMHMASTIDIFNNCELVWGDGRTGSSGIYAQDINMNGALGNPFIPVELEQFTASISGDNVILNWTTSTEKNNLGFEIERKEVSSFIKIGFVNGRGTTSERNNYSFTDNNPGGSSIYRLKQIDFDGTFTYSKIVEVKNLLPLEFSLEQNYPNPFNPSTIINYQLPADNIVTLSVFDILGNEIKTLVSEEKTAGSYVLTFNADNLPSGIYLYKIHAGNFVETRKMLMMK